MIPETNKTNLLKMMISNEVEELNQICTNIDQSLKQIKDFIYCINEDLNDNKKYKETDATTFEIVNNLNNETTLKGTSNREGK